MQSASTDRISVRFHSTKPENIPLRFVVIVSRYNGQWVLVRHRERDTYEIPGGHIKPGEDSDKAAERELFEETGAAEYETSLIGYYSVEAGERIDGGYLYFADIRAFSELPESEIAERALFEYKRKNNFCDIWLFRQNFDLEDITLQEGETVDAKWATQDEIMKMVQTGEFISFAYLAEFFKRLGKI